MTGEGKLKRTRLPYKVTEIIRRNFVLGAADAAAGVVFETSRHGFLLDQKGLFPWLDDR
jgi:hypothetical protein